MRNLNLLIILLILPLYITGKSISHIHNTVTNNKEELKLLIGENAAEVAGMVYSPEIQQYLTYSSSYKSEYTIKLDSLIDRNREYEEKSWQNEWKNDFQYNESWQATVINEYSWETSQNYWEPAGRIELSYNDAGQIELLEVFFEGDEAETKMEVSYDSSNLIDFLELYEFDEEEGWILMAIQDYSFNAENKPEEIVTLVYEEDEWVQVMAIRFDYDENGRRKSTGMYIIMDEGMDDLLYSLTEYTYNDAGQLIERVESEYDYFELELLPVYMQEYEYDEDGNQTIIWEYMWNSGEWAETQKEVVTYDHNVYFSEVAFPFRPLAVLFEWEMDQDPEIDFQKLPVEIMRYDYFEDDYVESYQSRFFFSPTADEPEEYTLRYLADDNGRIEGETEQIVKHGEDGSEVEAVPDEGYHFMVWSDGLETAKRTDLNITEDLTVTATFSVDTYTITASAGQGGSISPEGDITLDYGSTQVFTIEADEGYQTDDVLVDDESVGAVDSYTFENVQSNHSIHAIFSEETFEVTFRTDIGTALEYLEGFENFDPEEHSIYITGDMFAWEEPGTDPEQVMEASDNEYIYQATFNLAPGTYAYKYFSDAIGEGWDGGEWTAGDDREIIVEEDITVEDIFGFLDDPTSIHAVSENIDLSVFPNPATSLLRVESESNILEVRVIDITGRVVYTSSAGSNSHEVNVEDLMEGIYLLQVTTTQGKTTEKFQISR